MFSFVRLFKLFWAWTICWIFFVRLRKVYFLQFAQNICKSPILFASDLLLFFTDMVGWVTYEGWWWGGKALCYELTEIFYIIFRNILAFSNFRPIQMRNHKFKFLCSIFIAVSKKTSFFSVRVRHEKSNKTQCERKSQNHQALITAA